jgi:hypothetical protein
MSTDLFCYIAVAGLRGLCLQDRVGSFSRLAGNKDGEDSGEEVREVCEDVTEKSEGDDADDAIEEEEE